MYSRLNSWPLYNCSSGSFGKCSVKDGPQENTW